jgi:hypothetical protein
MAYGITAVASAAIPGKILIRAAVGNVAAIRARDVGDDNRNDSTN